MPNNQGPPQEEPENYGLPSNWQPLDTPPINPNIPSGGPPAPAINQLSSGPLPPTFNTKSPALVGTGYATGAIGLMDIYGGPQANSKTETIVRTVISGGGTNTGGEVVSFETNGIPNTTQDLLNLESGTNVTLVSDSVGGVTISSASQVISVAGVAAPGSTVNLNGTTPAPVSGTTNVVFQKDGGSPTTNVSAYMPLMVGDSGSGGTSGAVPAPPSGSAGAGDFLKANGTWAIPPGTGGAGNYQTVQQAGTSRPAEPKLNFLAPFLATDNPGNTSTDISLSSSVVAVDLTGQNNNISATTIATPGANGYYRISGWIVSTNTPTGASLPAVSIKFTDADSSTAQTVILLYSNVSVNASGAFGVINSSSSPGNPIWSGTFYAKSGVAVQYVTTGYAAGSGTALVYALHLRLEGPF